MQDLLHEKVYREIQAQAKRMIFQKTNIHAIPLLAHRELAELTGKKPPVLTTVVVIVDGEKTL